MKLKQSLSRLRYWAQNTLFLPFWGQKFGTARKQSLLSLCAIAIILSAASPSAWAKDEQKPESGKVEQRPDPKAPVIRTTEFKDYSAHSGARADEGACGP